MRVSNWDPRGALAVLQIPETPHLGLHSPNQHPRRPLKLELSPHGLSPLCTQRHNSSKHQDPWPRSQTQEVSEPGFKPRTLQLLLFPPPPTPHPGCQKTLRRHRRFLRSALQRRSLAGFRSHPQHGTELLKIHGAPHYMKRLGNSLSRAPKASILFLSLPQEACIYARKETAAKVGNLQPSAPSLFFKPALLPPS